jgi:hypothetical protein
MNDNPDSVVLELLALIAKQSATVDEALSRLTSYEKAIDEQNVLLGRYQEIIDGQQTRLDSCEHEHASFYRPSQRPVQDMVPINDWIN